MLDEATRRDLSLEYVRRINAGDVEGVIALFTEDVRFHDPVGGDPIIGHDALRKWLGVAIKGNLKETPGPAHPQNAPYVATPMTIEVDDPSNRASATGWTSSASATSTTTA
ncbi:nuclear transport factor 2 family protein [Streptomyces sp. M19]